MRHPAPVTLAPLPALALALALAPTGARAQDVPELRCDGVDDFPCAYQLDVLRLHKVPATLGRRYTQLPSDEKQLALCVIWAAALWEDPTQSRRALLRARHDKVAQDLGDDGGRARHAIEAWLSDVLAPAAFPMA